MTPTQQESTMSDQHKQWLEAKEEQSLHLEKASDAMDRIHAALNDAAAFVKNLEAIALLEVDVSVSLGDGRVLALRRFGSRVRVVIVKPGSLITPFSDCNRDIKLAALPKLSGFAAAIARRLDEIAKEAAALAPAKQD